MSVSEGVLTAVIATIGAAIGGIGTYLARRRTTAGTVQSSEAKDLWAEASAFRATQRETIADLSAAVDRLEVQVQALRKENGDLWARLRVREGAG